MRPKTILMQELFHNHKLKKYSNDIEALLRNASSVINDNFVYLDRPTKPGKVKSFFEMVLTKYIFRIRLVYMYQSF